MSEHKSKCDTRCQYAYADDSGCDCECGGANHGKGTDTRIWEAKEKRHSTTRRAFKEFLNKQEPGSGRKLYKKDRAEFNKQYAEFSGKTEEEVKAEESELEKPIVSTHVTGDNITVIKDQKFGEDVYSHVRRNNGKTEYRKNDKIITKASLPTELGW